MSPERLPSSRNRPARSRNTAGRRKRRFGGSSDTANRYRIRPVEPADLRQLVAIERLVFSDPWPLRGFEALGGWSRLVEMDGTAVGYVFARFMADEAEIMNLAIHPHHQRQGLGTRLLDTAIQAARAKGAQKVFLEVRVSNEPARCFYTALGFRTVGVRRGYYEQPAEDAMILCRDLGFEGPLA